MEEMCCHLGALLSKSSATNHKRVTMLKDALASCPNPCQDQNMEEMWSHLGALEKLPCTSFAKKHKRVTILSFYTAPLVVDHLQPGGEPRN